MIFEIDDKTGLIKSFIFSADITLTINNDEIKKGDDAAIILADSTELEEILQAIKKTQVKLVNKQIQEIQDSKNYISLEPDEELKFVEVDPKITKAVGFPNEYDPRAKSSFSPATKAEQNQKIVDLLIQYHNECLANFRPYDDIIAEKLNIIFRNITGQNIKDRNN